VQSANPVKVRIEAGVQTGAPKSLAHLPGWRAFGPIDNTLAILRDSRGFYEASEKRFGRVFTSSFLGSRNVQFLGPDANEWMLSDREGSFSSQLGWRPYLDRVFPRGVISMDFDEHRLHRRALSVAFKSGAMRAYFERLDLGIAEWLDGWRAPPPLRSVYPEMKRMALGLAAKTFLGVGSGPEADALNQAFIAEVAATVSLVRAPLPLTAMGRGVKARSWLVDHLIKLIRSRRKGDGADLLSELCRATLDDGRPLTDQEIADHMNMLMMAAHDTLASSLSAFVWLLAIHPDWQTELRAEAFGLGLRPSDPTPFDSLGKLKFIEMAFKEALRMVPPLGGIPRRTIRDVQFKGFHIPADVGVGVAPIHTHHMPELWPEPDRFDPMRFTDAAERARHRYAFVPFGGGAHMCLGLHYALMQARSFGRHLLQRFEFRLPSGAKTSWSLVPIAKPRGGLPVEFRPI
jgi:cytochrome P450